MMIESKCLQNLPAQNSEDFDKNYGLFDPTLHSLSSTLQPLEMDKDCSAYKSSAVLSFDAYGNLTSSDDPDAPYSHEVPSLAEFDYILNSFEGNSQSESSKSGKSAGKKNGSIKKTRSKNIKLENNNKLNEPYEIPDKDLKQAFKKDFDSTSLSVTSRYGRTRKQKAQDGFLFGTINFNELRKITSTSPKKNRYSSSDSKSDSEVVEYDEEINPAKTFEVLAEKSGYSSEDDFVIETKTSEAYKSKKKRSLTCSSNGLGLSTNLPLDNGNNDKLEAEEILNQNLKKDKEIDKTHSEGNENIRVNKSDRKVKLRNKKEKVNEISSKGKGLTNKNNKKFKKEPQKPNKDVQKQNMKVIPVRKKGNSKSNIKKEKENKAKTKKESLQTSPATKTEGRRMRSSKRKIEESEDSLQPQCKVQNVDENSGKDFEELNALDSNSSPSVDTNAPELDSVSKESVQQVPNFNYWKNDMEELESIEEDVNIIKSSLSIFDSSEITSNTSDIDEVLTTVQTVKKESETGMQSMKTEDTKLMEMEATKDVKVEEHRKTKSGRPVKKPEIIDVTSNKRKSRESCEKLNASIVKEELLETTVDQDPNWNSEYPCLYFIGDVVWVNMRGFPFWPGLIIYPKDETEFTRFKNTMGAHKMKPLRQYHIQFFNDNHQTMWVTSHSVTPYNGLPKLVDYLEEMKASIKKGNKLKRNSASLKFFMKAYNRIYAYMQKEKKVLSKRQRWYHAIEDADIALGLDRYERIQRFQPPEKKKKRKNDVDKISEAKDVKPMLDFSSEIETHSIKLETSSNKSKSSDEFSGFDDDTSFKKKKVKRLKLENRPRQGDFEVYLQKHLESTSEDLHLTKEKARKLLQKKWNKLTPAQRARYKSKRHYDPLISITDAEDSSSDMSSVSSFKSRRSLNDDDGIEPSKGTYRVPKNEKTCVTCEGPSLKPGGVDMVKCKGPCGSVFHQFCVRLGITPASDFKCAECLSGYHKCFVCKSEEAEVVKCSVPSCGKFYHDSCVRQWPQVSKARQSEKLICPRHVCHMCAANSDDMNDPAAKTPPFTRCLRCPTTYHTGETCIAAGAEEISQNSHICTKHMKLSKNNAHHFNVNWCFCCSKGGSLLLCDQCPAAFHAECLNITAPDGGYVCDDCENGKFPVYGDIVWVKLGTYRWWPGEVLHPKYIPDNIENLQHVQGMFCVRFFGTDDYYWLSRGRTFHYQEGDQGSKKNANTFIEQKFKKALEEAVIAYNIQKERRILQEQNRSLKGNMKPPPYVRIDTNRPVGTVRLARLDPSSVTKCDCDPYSENPCGSDDKCINRMLMVECVKEVCGAKDRCKNQRFQRRQYPTVFPFKTAGRGWGLKTKDFIKKGEFVIEYVGELIDETEFRRRIDEMHEHKEQNYYFLTVETDRMIDAGPKGNLARFMNHSCLPNCETQKWTVGADTRVGLFALEDIAEGSELTFNYNLECVGTEKKKCNCGAPNCSGFIGVKVQKNESSHVKNGISKKKKRGRKKKNAKDTENECFRCGNDGDLILCDITVCPKGYHLECLGLEDLPKGKWICPWHHCDECGARSFIRCIMCPNSYCRSHSGDKFHNSPGLGNVCLEHGSDDFETGSDESGNELLSSRENSPEVPT